MDKQYIQDNSIWMPFCFFWLWTLSWNHDGYGLTSRFGQVIAHRLAYQAFIGPIPPGLCVLHYCDTPACVNPNHLYVGTHADNVKDKVRKGRQAKGERHGSITHPEKLARGDKHYSRINPEKLVRGERHWARAYPEKLARGKRHWKNIKVVE